MLGAYGLCDRAFGDVQFFQEIVGCVQTWHVVCTCASSVSNPGMANNQDEQKDKEDGNCTRIYVYIYIEVNLKP